MELALEKGTVINQKYMVEKKLETKVKNQINYLCIEIKTKKQVLVKEFCPAYALRDENGHMKLGESDLNEYASFLNKNRMAEKFQTIPTLMSVLEVFEANNTCYAVGEYVQGETKHAGLAVKGNLPVARHLMGKGLQQPPHCAVGLSSWSHPSTSPSVYKCLFIVP